MGRKKMLHAGIKCSACGDIVFSTYRHDFRCCRCEKVAVDGGYDYFRIVGSLKDYTIVYLYAEGNSGKKKGKR